MRGQCYCRRDDGARKPDQAEREARDGVEGNANELPPDEFSTTNESRKQAVNSYDAPGTSCAV